MRFRWWNAEAPRVHPLPHIKLATMRQTCDQGAWEVEAKGSEIQGHSDQVRGQPGLQEAMFSQERRQEVGPEGEGCALEHKSKFTPQFDDA